MKDPNFIDNNTQSIWNNESQIKNKPNSNHSSSLDDLPQTISLNVTPAAVPLSTEEIRDLSESEEGAEWEEVDVLDEGTMQTGLPIQAVEVVIQSEGGKTKKRAVNVDPLQRTLRLESHKMHTVALLASFGIRNKWANDILLHARLLSMTPLPLQTAFSMIHRKTEPDSSRRSRLFLTACFKLTEWWHSRFQVIKDKGIRSQTFLEVEQQRKIYESRQVPLPPEINNETGEDDDDEPAWSDRLRTAKSLMKHALTRRGSADTSSILFTALCRALDIPARLVVSLQSVPWSSKHERISKYTREDIPSDPDVKDPNTIPSQSRAVKQLNERPKENKNKSSTIPQTFGMEVPPLEGWPPVVWTEVFSRPEGRWIPIDSTRYLVDKKRLFEPPPNCRINRMMYVVAFEEDGFIRDVTLRYARHFGAKTSKARASSRRGQSDWWERVVACLTRPYRLNRDDTEDAELQSLQHLEGMPTSVGGFKDHPLYALERHLRRDEVIHPLHEIGKFRGESVYPRTNVQRIRSAETWMREGKIIREGQQPLKRVVQRAHTINGKRALEIGRADGLSEPATQGLYAEWQTEIFVPEPVVNGTVPKNNFGNINLFAPNMLPNGAVHIPIQGIAKVARQLGIDHAPAVTGFEFRKGHANPIVNGIVVATENEELVVSAYWESEQAVQEAERVKRHERVVRRWTRLVQGLRVRKRLTEEYGSAEYAVSGAADSQSAPAPGGFLTEYDGIIEPFNLPKALRVHIDESATKPVASEELQSDDWSIGVPEASLDPHYKPDIAASNPNIIPKSLRERAGDYFRTKEEVPNRVSSPLPKRHSRLHHSVQSRKKRRKRPSQTSSHDSESFSESERSSKRARTRALSPPRRQLRPRKG
ncbi:hypothetical protein FRC18_010627 [Serendipita sp. 400]|nr:hypothetical protein FRC18_010627 [Serendipita sp. 400]